MSYTATLTLGRPREAKEGSALAKVAQRVNGVRGSPAQALTPCPVHLWVARMGTGGEASTPVLVSLRSLPQGGAHATHVGCLLRATQLIKEAYLSNECVHVCACACVHKDAGSLVGQKRILDPLELELQMGVDHLILEREAKLGSTMKTARTLKLTFFFFNVYLCMPEHMHVHLMCACA